MNFGFDGFFFEESEANSFFNQSDSTVWGASGSGTSSGNPAKALVMKQYRNNTLIYRGLMILWGNYEAAATSSPSGGPTKGSGRRTAPSGGFGTVSNLSDFEVGDVITTQLQEDSVNAIGAAVIARTAARNRPVVAGAAQGLIKD